MSIYVPPIWQPVPDSGIPRGPPFPVPDPAVGPPGPPGPSGPPGPTGPAGPSGNETFVYQNGGTPYILPLTPSMNDKVTVIDNTGTPGIVINTADGSLINGHPTFADYLQPFAVFSFVWNGSEWRVV